jgi:hypothetical protein
MSQILSAGTVAPDFKLRVTPDQWLYLGDLKGRPKASVSAPAITGQPGRFSQPRICGSGLFDLFSKNIAKID